MIATYLRPMRDAAELQHLECERDCKVKVDFIVVMCILSCSESLVPHSLLAAALAFSSL